MLKNINFLKDWDFLTLTFKSYGQGYNYMPMILFCLEKYN